MQADDPLEAAALSPDVPVRNAEAAAPKRAKLTVKGKTMQLTAPLPTKPGAYTLHVGIRDRRFGNAFVTSHDIALFIPGERRATLRLNLRERVVEADQGLRLSVNVANTGTETWAGEWALDTGAGQMDVERGTRVVARWVPLDEAATDADGASLEPVVIGTVPLAPGEMVTVRDTVVAPAALGRWALVIDVVDDVDGSYAALGSEPAVAAIEVVAPRGRDPQE